MTSALRRRASELPVRALLLAACVGCNTYGNELLLPATMSEPEPAGPPSPSVEPTGSGPEPTPSVTPSVTPEPEPDSEPTPPVSTEPQEPEPTAPEPEPEPTAPEPEPEPTMPPDECPDSDKFAPGVCGCDAPDADADGDGALDCMDECPDDPEKTQPGACDCGTPDTDTDGDDEPDCLDQCPDDPEKTEPGECGCGVAEDADSSMDSDMDGAPDCIDECPADPDKTEAGSCGCGHADDELDDDPVCELLTGALVHRYDFAGTGTSLADRVGDANGSVMNTALQGEELTLAGSDEYVNLPTRVLEDLSDVTIEVWFTWDGADPWQRVFDFGSNDAGAGAQGVGTSYLFLTPESNAGGPPGLRTAFRATGQAEVFVAVSAIPAVGVELVVAVVLDDTNDQLLLYRDGAPLGSAALTYGLGDIEIANTWIGRSQFLADPSFIGSINEFRVYSKALSAEEIEYSFEQGADPGYL